VFTAVAWQWGEAADIPNRRACSGAEDNGSSLLAVPLLLMLCRYFPAGRLAVKVHCIEGPAKHRDPESCAATLVGVTPGLGQRLLIAGQRYAACSKHGSARPDAWVWFQDVLSAPIQPWRN
jgi:hypothetical protein